MRGECAIQAEGLSKKFSRSLRDTMWYGLWDSAQEMIGLATPKGELRTGEFWAVDDVSFELNRGKCLGIMGINGSGKTTLLRLLNAIYKPDRGSVRMRGTVGALISAGAGFSPMLTGRENIYVNASLLGMSSREVDARLDEIIAMAEIGPFIDSPVRHYSSGMQVRLGFATAAMSSPDILLVDEVLAVGDLRFQKRCYEYIHRLKSQGTSIVLVSHSIGAIWAVCDEGMLLHKGKLECRGSVDDVIYAYNDRNMSLSAVSTSAEVDAMPADYSGSVGGTGDATVLQTRLLNDSTMAATSEVGFREGFLIESVVQVHKVIEEPVFRYAIDAVHYKFITCLDSFDHQFQTGRLMPGEYRLLVRVPRQNFMPGAYTINMAILQRTVGVHLFFQLGACRFQVMQPAAHPLISDDNAVVFLDAEFRLDSESGRNAA